MKVHGQDALKAPDDPPVMFAPLTEAAAGKIMDAIERLKKIPTGIRFVGADGETLIDHKVEQALRIDPTGISAALMVMARAKEFGEGITFTANDVLSMSKEDLALLKNLQELRDLCAAPEIDAPIAAFQSAIKGAAIQYGLLVPKVEAVINDRPLLAHIRTSALRCMENFEVHQFNQGGRSKAGFHYNRVVHEFNNVNSAIRITAMQPVDGVTMALIRDPEIAEFSYFVFIARSGENITLLTDKPDFSNPEQKYMRRNPGRDLEHRLDSNWFPYGVLDIKVDHRGNFYIPKETSGKLVVYQTEAIQLCELSKLDPREIVWALLMFDLITQRFHRENRHTKQLSYTGEMLRLPMALHEGTQLSLRGYRQLDVPALTLDQVTTDATKATFRAKPTEFNRWMEERYASMVNPELFSVLETPDHKTLKLADSPAAGALMAFTGKEEKHRGIKTEPTYAISHLPAETFGTKRQILKDYKWVARKNLATAIQALANEEFEREFENVVSWYRKAVRKNMRRLRSAIWSLELVVPHIKYESGFRIGPHKIETQNILTIVPAKDKQKRRDAVGYLLPSYCYHSGGWSTLKQGYFCLDYPATLASTLAIFRPSTPEAIAALAGCEVKDMPVWLQHWYKNEPYHGNSILDDVDPMECVLHNPWRHDNWHEGFRPTIVIAFSKTALKDWSKGDMDKPLEEIKPPAWVKKLKKQDYVYTTSGTRFSVGRTWDDGVSLWRNGRRRIVSRDDLARLYRPDNA